MKKLLVLLIIGLAACGGSSGGGSSTPASTSINGAAEQAWEEQLNQYINGQFNQLYQTLHPTQQRLVSEETYVACVQEHPLPADTTFTLIDQFEEEIQLPGTIEVWPTVAFTATVESDSSGESMNRTFHVINVDGQWRWMSSDLTVFEGCQS